MAETNYPITDEARIGFWTSQIEQADQFYRPFFDAGAAIVKMYNNMAGTARESTLELSDDGDNDVRTKAGIVFAWIDQSVAAMIGTADPQFSAKAKRKVSTNGAPTVSNNINYWWGETDQPSEDEQVVFDAHCMPWGVKKIGWEFEEEAVEELQLMDLAVQVHEDPVTENEFLRVGEATKITREQDHAYHIATHEQILEDPDLDPDVKNFFVIPHIERHKEFRENIQPRPSSRVKWQAPFGIRWNPGDFLMDPWAATGLADARWIAFRIRQPVYRWQADKALKNTDGIKPNAKLKGGDPRKGGMRRLFARDSSDGDTFDQFGIAEGWEIWARDFPVGANKRRNMVITFIPGHDKLLRHEEEWPYTHIDGYPAEVLHFQQNMQTWCNKPLLSLAGADNMQVLVNEFLDSMLYTMRKSKNVLFVDKDAFADNTITNLKEAPEGSIIPIEGLAQSQGRAIQAAPFLQIQGDKNQYMGLLRAMIDETAGTPQPSRRQDPETATEAAIIERRVAAREGRRNDRFEKYQVNTARKFWQLQQQFRPDTSDLIDPRSGAVQQQVTEDIAKGEYLFNIEVSSSREAMAVEQKQAMDRLNLFMGATPLLTQTFQIIPNIPQMMEDVLRASGIKDVERYLPGRPDEVTAEVNRQMQEDPIRRLEIMSAMQSVKSPGGAQASGGIGPIDSQAFAANPNTNARANAEAERVDEGGAQ